MRELDQAICTVSSLSGGAVSERDGIEQDHYELLGISEDATADDIKQAFRELAKRFHPDSNPNDARAQARFTQVSRAYETLSDGPARAAYDESRAVKSSLRSAVGWYKDPYNLHELRWFSVGRATHLVRDGDVTSSDDPPAEPFNGPLVAPDEVPVRNETVRAGDGPDGEIHPFLIWRGSDL
jgi:curved DNA-binding protein CbpA